MEALLPQPHQGGPLEALSAERPPHAAWVLHRSAKTVETLPTTLRHSAAATDDVDDDDDDDDDCTKNSQTGVGIFLSLQ